jgi:hypothetical protein
VLAFLDVRLSGAEYFRILATVLCHLGKLDLPLNDQDEGRAWMSYGAGRDPAAPDGCGPGRTSALYVPGSLDPNRINQPPDFMVHSRARTDFVIQQTCLFLVSEAGIWRRRTPATAGQSVDPVGVAPE